MITEKDLDEAIARYQGQANYTPSDCVKMAALYILKDKQYETEKPMYSYANTPEQPTFDSGTEFSKLIQGLDTNTVYAMFDELMEYLYVYEKGLYNKVIRKLKER